MPTHFASSGTSFPSHPLETLLFLALTRLLLQYLMLLSLQENDVHSSVTTEEYTF
jgi:hypothetical protein